MIKFDVSNRTHLDFIVAASKLLAYMYFIDQTQDREYIKQEVSKIQIPKFEPKTGVKFYEDVEQLKADAQHLTPSNEAKFR